MKRILKKLLKPEAIFFTASLLASLIHYLFQVIAARTLDSNQFADLSYWMAWVSTWLAVSMWSQYSGTFVTLTTATQRALQIIAVTWSLLGAVILLFANPDPKTIGFITIYLAVPFGFLFGALQRQLLFVTLSVASLVLAISKLAIPQILGTTQTQSHYLGFALCYLPALFCLVILRPKLRLQEIPTPKGFKRRQLASALVLAFVASIVPQIDILVIRNAFGEDMLSQFAPASLFYKGFFFFLLIIAQITLPHQINKKRKAVLSFKFISVSVFVAIIAWFLSQPVFQLLLPFVLGKELSGLWVPHATVHTVVLTLLFLVVQELCSISKLKPALFLACLLFAEVFIFAYLKLNLLNAEQYFLICSLIELIAIGFIALKDWKKDSLALKTV